jgi:hypothetical protein
MTSKSSGLLAHRTRRKSRLNPKRCRRQRVARSYLVPAFLFVKCRFAVQAAEKSDTAKVSGYPFVGLATHDVTEW